MSEAKNKNDRIVAEVRKCMEQDRMRLLARQPFIGTVLLHLELVPVLDLPLCPTAMTDGRAVYADCRFYAGLDSEERLFVMAHEAWHCVLLHFVRRQTRDKLRFNIAADLEIHFVLLKEKMKEPFVLPHDPAWEGLSAEEIYEKLDSKKARKAPGRSSNGLQGGADGDGFDRHVYQGEAAGDDSDRVDEATVERIRRVVIQAAQIAERRQGTLPGHIRDVVDKLRKPELNWQELLKQFVTSCYGGSRRWLPPARRYVGMGLYLQSRRSERLEAVLAVDTSGSTAQALPRFFAELSGLLQSFGNYELTVIQCDSRIQHVETFSDACPPPGNRRWESFGHGGTSFAPPFDYVREHGIRPQVFIYLTDGAGDAPETPPPFPVLWVLTSDGEVPAKWGKCIRLKRETTDGD